MTDAIDKACEREQIDRDLAIKSARKSEQVTKATGHCLWCNAALAQGKRWCDADCREDWELNKEAVKRHRGRRYGWCKSGVNWCKKQVFFEQKALATH